MRPRANVLTVAGSAALAGAAAGQGTMTLSWTMSDTGDGDGLIRPWEQGIARLYALMDPPARGLASAVYDIEGIENGNWANGEIVSFDNFLDAQSDDGTLDDDNAIRDIESSQLPPLFNPDFNADNPLLLYEIYWAPPPPPFDGSHAVFTTTNHLRFDVYVDDTGTIASYKGVAIPGSFFLHPAPGTLGPLAIGINVLWRRRRDAM